jgi:hypothetical protein
MRTLVNLKPSIPLPRIDDDEDDLPVDLEDNGTLDPSLTVRPLNVDNEIIECEELSERSFDLHSASPTPGPKKRQMSRITEKTGAEKAKWQRIIEAVTLDYIHMGPEPILPGGDGHRQNLDHRRLRGIIATRHKEFFGALAILDDSHTFMVKWLHLSCVN